MSRYVSSSKIATRAFTVTRVNGDTFNVIATVGRQGESLAYVFRDDKGWMPDTDEVHFGYFTANPSQADADEYMERACNYAQTLAQELQEREYTAKDEAIATADAALNNALLPTYTELQDAIRDGYAAMASLMKAYEALKAHVEGKIRRDDEGNLYRRMQVKTTTWPAVEAFPQAVKALRHFLGAGETTEVDGLYEMTISCTPKDALAAVNELYPVCQNPKWDDDALVLSFNYVESKNEQQD